MLKRTTKWSLIPDTKVTFEMTFGYDENKRSSVFPEAGRVGDLTFAARLMEHLAY